LQLLPVLLLLFRQKTLLAAVSSSGRGKAHQEIGWTLLSRWVVHSETLRHANSSATTSLSPGYRTASGSCSHKGRWHCCCTAAWSLTGCSW